MAHVLTSFQDDVSTMNTFFHLIGLNWPRGLNDEILVAQNGNVNVISL